VFFSRLTRLKLATPLCNPERFPLLSLECLTLNRETLHSRCSIQRRFRIVLLEQIRDHVTTAMIVEKSGLHSLTRFLVLNHVWG